MVEKLSKPFHGAGDLDSESVKNALRHLEFRADVLTGHSDLDCAEREKISQYVDGIKSLTYVNEVEYADFVRHRINSGVKVTYITPRSFDETISLFKTTQPVTHLPAYTPMPILVMPGHTVLKENPNDKGKIYNWLGNDQDSQLVLPRDLVTVMLARLWKPTPEHFAETCLKSEVEKILQRGRKRVRAYADFPFAIQEVK